MLLSYFAGERGYQDPKNFNPEKRKLLKYKRGTTVDNDGLLRDKKNNIILEKTSKKKFNAERQNIADKAKALPKKPVQQMFDESRARRQATTPRRPNTYSQATPKASAPTSPPKSKPPISTSTPSPILKPQAAPKTVKTSYLTKRNLAIGGGALAAAGGATYLANRLRNRNKNRR